MTQNEDRAVVVLGEFLQSTGNVRHGDQHRSLHSGDRPFFGRAAVKQEMPLRFLLEQPAGFLGSDLHPAHDASPGLTAARSVPASCMCAGTLSQEAEHPAQTPARPISSASAGDGNAPAWRESDRRRAAPAWSMTRHVQAGAERSSGTWTSVTNHADRSVTEMLGASAGTSASPGAKLASDTSSLPGDPRDSRSLSMEVHAPISMAGQTIAAVIRLVRMTHATLPERPRPRRIRCRPP